MVNHWLMKSEPDVYPWKQLVKEGTTHWDGVRNYQARNIMRDKMKIGDLVYIPVPLDKILRILKV